MTFLPHDKCAERENAIINAVERGDMDVSFLWAVIRTAIPGHTATFLVFSDALILKRIQYDRLECDSVRVSVSAHTSQVIADMLDSSLLTPYLADEIWKQADVVVDPYPMVKNTADTLLMSTTDWMVKHSKAIDKKFPAFVRSCDRMHLFTPEREAFGDKAPAQCGALCSTVGKHWVLEKSKHNGMAVNYGWHFAGPKFEGNTFERTVSGDTRLIQGCGYHHNEDHTDYSQTLVLVRQDCLVDGKLHRLNDMLLDPELAKLANISGTLDVNSVKPKT